MRRFCCKRPIVFKADRVQVFLWLLVWLQTALFGKSICYLSTFGKWHCHVWKVSRQGSVSWFIARVYLKESSVFLVSTIIRIRTRSVRSLLRKKIEIFCACANSVYQASPRGGGAWEWGYHSQWYEKCDTFMFKGVNLYGQSVILLLCNTILWPVNCLLLNHYIILSIFMFLFFNFRFNEHYCHFSQSWSVSRLVKNKGHLIYSILHTITEN